MGEEDRSEEIHPMSEDMTQDEYERQMEAYDRMVSGESDDDDSDPYAKYESHFREVESGGFDYFDIFIYGVLHRNDRAERTVKHYETTYRHWKAYMETQDRHPAAMNVSHVKGFIEYLRREEENNNETIHRKIKRLNYTFEFWCDMEKAKHSQDYNPFATAMKWANLDEVSPKEPPNISLEEMREIVRGVKNIEERAIIVLMLKLGLRAGEVCNMKISDLTFDNPEIEKYYPEFGSHPRLEGRENAVYIPPKEDNKLGIPGRKYNKSGAPRVLPIDGDVQFVLETYLITRPKVDAPWVFINRRFNEQFDSENINERWVSVFRPEYDETEYTRAVTSHFGRHYFTTWWRSEKQLDRDLVKYMRGDVSSTDENGNSVFDEPIDKYIHTQFEHIRDVYDSGIFWFGLGEAL